MSRAITWQEFRDKYYRLHTSKLKSAVDTESRLNIIERIMKPDRLVDLTSTEALARLQQQLLAGAESRPPAKGEKAKRRPRSPHTVRTFMAVLAAALSWAEYMKMIDTAPRIRKIKVAKLKHMKGRPITSQEMELLLHFTEAVVGSELAESWRHTLRGLWTSGLRLGELMNVSWDCDNLIRPIWIPGQHAVLRIPAEMQKNQTEETIPLLPEFEQLLLETPESKRIGWAFNPRGSRAKFHRVRWRIQTVGVGRVISKIGRQAGIIVAGAAIGRRVKYASAHDLRRSCADRLIASGVPEREVARIMRHSSIETTRRYYAPSDVQRTAEIIKQAHEASQLSGQTLTAPGNPSLQVPTSTQEAVADRFDQRWLVQAVREATPAKGTPKNRGWSPRIAAVKAKFNEIMGGDGPFPWSDAIVIDLWGQFHGNKR